VLYSDIIGGMTTVPRKLTECPVCGTKRSSIQTSGLVGCPLCYVVFDETVRQMAPLRV